MKSKFCMKSTCVLLTAFLTSIPIFAMKSTKMPNYARNMFMKMHKPLSDEIKLAKLNNYMYSICKKIFEPNNTNPMVKWAIQHSKPADISKTIYQIWANGAKRTESVINCNSTLGKAFFVLPEALRTQALEDAKKQIKKFIPLAINILYRNYTADKTHSVHTEKEFESKILLDSLNGGNTLRYKVDEMLRQGDCWYSFDQPGMTFWSDKVTKELIGDRTITFREMIDILSQTAKRTDFFGRYIIGACIAYKKCEELGLPCEFAKNNNYHVVIVNINGKRYIVNYSAGVLNMAANRIVHENLIQEINDITYRKFEILSLDIPVKMNYGQYKSQPF